MLAKDHEHPAGDEGLDDVERAGEEADEERDTEQDDADDDIGAGPSGDEEE
jgi:hypothetical protein